MKLYKNDKEVELTAVEFNLLFTLFKNKGQVLNRELLGEVEWKDREDIIKELVKLQLVVIYKLSSNITFLSAAIGTTGARIVEILLRIILFNSRSFSW